jgi:hypothetical protein
MRLRKYFLPPMRMRSGLFLATEAQKHGERHGENWLKCKMRNAE